MDLQLSQGNILCMLCTNVIKYKKVLLQSK